jgi:hypothetical protein
MKKKEENFEKEEIDILISWESGEKERRKVRGKEKNS